VTIGASPVQGLAIVGPTASGKTALSLALAEALDGEIISMDSRQVYRRMDIGTDKVSAEARARVPHHGLDLVEPWEAYSAGQYGRDARRWIREIRDRGRVPVFVGGTGFFLRALTSPVFEEPSLDPTRRAAFRSWASAQSVDRLSQWVSRLDPQRAGVAQAGGPQRLIRTLEVALLSGRPLSWWHAHAPPTESAVSLGIIRLQVPREVLVARIEARVDRMFASGLVAEVESLIRSGARPSDPGMTGTGYRECARLLAGETTQAEAWKDIARETRQYARRQETWFRHQLPEGVLELDGLLSLEEQMAQIREIGLPVWGIGSHGKGVGDPS
jgi:tRNA dimethylallyltransferase